MSTVLLSSKAKADLKHIAYYTERRWGLTQRNIYLKRFHRTFQFLSENPLSGKACDSIRTGYRKFHQGSHVIYYRTGSAGEILITRILHKCMDVDQVQ